MYILHAIIIRVLIFILVWVRLGGVPLFYPLLNPGHEGLVQLVVFLVDVVVEHLPLCIFEAELGCHCRY